MSVVHPQIRFSYDDYKTLPESMEKRYELLDGDLVMVPVPSIRHQRIAVRLVRLLADYAEGRGRGIILSAPTDVVLGEAGSREVVQPDVIFVSRSRAGIIAEDEIRGAPDLVVEILSPTTEARDRGYKLRLYGRHGVGECWIVDPIAETVDVYAAVSGTFDRTLSVHAPEPLLSSLFEDLTIDVGDVFREDWRGT